MGEDSLLSEDGPARDPSRRAFRADLFRPLSLERRWKCNVCAMVMLHFWDAASRVWVLLAVAVSRVGAKEGKDPNVELISGCCPLTRIYAPSSWYQSVYWNVVGGRVSWKFLSQLTHAWYEKNGGYGYDN